MNIDDRYIDDIIRRAVMEDMPYGDITTDSLLTEQDLSKAELISKKAGMIAGIHIAKRVFLYIDHTIDFRIIVDDGGRSQPGEKIAVIYGKTASILKGERIALNILQRMSGIATLTDEFVQRIKPLNTRIVDTRKTTPGLRRLEKYAVTVGGGYNHRFGLSDAVMIKDNHIVAAGGILNAVERIRKQVPHTVKIEVETETLEQVKEAVGAKADIIMLDNMDCEEMKTCVQWINGRAVTEASGNITLDNVNEKAKTGVNIISIGALTHSVQALDISLKFL